MLVLSAVLAAIAAGQQDLFDALETPVAETQGVELLLVTVAAMVVAGFAIPPAVTRFAPAIASLTARLRPAPERSTRKRKAFGAAIATVALAAVLVASGAVSKVADEFTADEFEGNTVGAERLTSLNSNTRAEYWSSAIDAGAENPVLGIGPGTWEFWWARGGESGPFARDSHSLYLEAFAELGVPGALLIAAFVITILAAGIGAARREPDPLLRSAYAALTGSVFAFAIAAGLDWAWEVTVLPAAFVLAGAPLLIAGGRQESPAGSWKLRAATCLAAALALAATVPVLLSEWQIERSQDQAARGELEAALGSAESAGTLRGYAAAPLLQRALVQEALGELDGAADSAREAAEREPFNWRHEFVLSRIEEARGELAAAREAFERGRLLNPRSPAFADPP